jgi:multimeric flavodoxin WrbA
MTSAATKVAVVYHSGYGHTQRQAEAVADGALAAGAEAALYRADDLLSPDKGPWAELAEADAIVFGTPTYMGNVSGVFKTFMDASSKAWAAGQWKDKIAAAFTNSASQSGDKLATLQALAVFGAQHGMMWTPLGLPAGNNSSKGSVADLNRLGAFLGAMAQSNADEGPDKGPIASDLATAGVLGERVAKAAARWKAGAGAPVQEAAQRLVRA